MALFKLLFQKLLSLKNIWSMPREKKVFFSWLKNSPVASSSTEAPGAIALPDLPDWPEIRREIDSLPAAYKEAFLPAPLDKNVSLFAGSEEALFACSKSVERWQRKLPVLTALVGPDGSGLTTLLNRLEKDLSTSNRVMRVFLASRIDNEEKLFQTLSGALKLPEPTGGVESLIEHLKALDPSIILMDDFHHLYLRRMGASKVIDACIRIILATQRHHLWIMTFKEGTWKRLTHQHGLQKYFTDVVPVPYLDEDAFSSALRARIDSCGIPLLFIECLLPAPSNDKACEEEANEVDPERALKQCIRQSYNLTQGNLGATFFFWSMGASQDFAKKEVSIRLPARIDYSILRNIAPLHRLTLVETVVHGGLTPNEHQAIFQCSREESLLLLEYLFQKRIMEKCDPHSGAGEIAYRISQVCYQQIISTLEAAHLLY